ncbi:hypothetical protein AVEN_3569-1 [Araneus ventricosus]|uniref:Monocarboxylate transporter 12 n=1 Tax=Araneus ventricosus TaxID=182803 RepID=A0A4Y2PJX5_ARAVE|nr:hypothetical protein AVEN_3569-1 [Araneus ventricosus]
MIVKSLQSPEMKFSPSDIRSGVAVATCFFICGILLGTTTLSSLLFVASMKKFNIDRERASFPFLLCYTTKNVFGPVIGFLGNKFGLKRIILFGSLLSSVAVGTCFFAEDILTITILWGVLFGFSFGLGVALLPQVLGMHFSKHLDKAVGINVGSGCVGSFLLMLLTDYLLKSYGLSGTFLILSCVVLHSVPAAMLISIPKKVEKAHPLTENMAQNVKPDTFEEVLPCAQQLEFEFSQNEIGGQKMTVTSPVPSKESLVRKSSIAGFKVLLDPTYILILITQSSYMYVCTMISIILFDVSRDHGVSETGAVHILVGYQIADAVGRFTLGIITDHGCMSKANFSAVCFAAIGLLFVSFIWIKGFAEMMAFVLATGFFQGGLMMMSPSIVMHYVDKDCHSMAIASRYLLYPPISFTQAPLIGYFRDTLRSYDGLICILVGICCMCSVVSFLIPPLVRFRERGKENLQVTKNPNFSK